MLKRILNLFRGWMSKLIGSAESVSADAMLESEKEKLRDNIGKCNKALAANAALVESLNEKDILMDKEAESLKSKAKLAHSKGYTDLAESLALQYQKLVEDNKAIEDQLAEARSQYDVLVASRNDAVRVAKEKISYIERTMDEAKGQEALADMNELASSMITDMGGTGDTLNRLEKQVKDRKNMAKGRSIVSKSQLDSDKGEGSDLLQEIEGSSALDSILNES